AGEPLLVVGVTRGRLLHVGDAADFVAGFLLGLADNGVSRDSKLHWRQMLVLRATGTQVSDFLRDAVRSIAVHPVGIVLFGDQLFCARRLDATVDAGPRLLHRLRLQHVVFDAIVFAGIGKVIARPHAVDDVEPFAGARITIVVLLEVHAIFLRFVG